MLKHLKSPFFIVCFLIFLLSICFYEVFFLNKTFKAATLNPQALATGVFGQEENKIDFFPIHSTTTSFMEEPIFEFVKNSLWKDHSVPLWNPYQGMGYPLISMMHHGIFWPIHLVYYLLPNIISWDLVILLRLLIGGLLTYWFLKKLGLETLPSLSGAAAFMLSAPMTLFQYGFVNVDILLPLLLIFIESLLDNPNRRTCVVLSLGVWLTFLAGHPEHIVVVNGFAGLYFLFRLLTHPQKPFRSIPFFISAYFLGVLLSSFVFWPFLRDWKIAFWHTHPENMGTISTGNNITGYTFLSFLFPGFFQDVPVKMNFDRPTLWGYIGIVPVGLFILGLFNSRHKRLSLLFGLLAIFLFLKTYCGNPLINWVGHIPLINKIRFDFHTAHLFAFLIAVTAAFGMDVFLKKKNAWVVFLVFTGTVAIIGLTGLKIFKTDVFGANENAVIFGVILSLIVLVIAGLCRIFFQKSKLFGSLLLAVFVFEIFCYLPHERPRRMNSFPRIPYVEFLQKHDPFARVYATFWTLYPNTATGYQINDFAINYGLLMQRYVDFINHAYPGYFKKDFARSAFSVNPVSLMKGSRSLFDIASVKYSITPKNFKKFLPEEQPSLTPMDLVYDGEVDIYKHPTALPHVYIVHRAISAESPDSVLDLTFKSPALPPAGIILEQPLPKPIADSLLQTPLHDQSDATIEQYRPNHVEINVTMQNPGFLVLADLYHPDWKVFIDGKEKQLYAADFILRAVYLSQGKHHVSFQYRPKAFYAGLAVSATAFLVLCLLWSWKKKR